MSYDHSRCIYKKYGRIFDWKILVTYLDPVSNAISILGVNDGKGTSIYVRSLPRVNDITVPLTVNNIAYIILEKNISVKVIYSQTEVH